MRALEVIAHGELDPDLGHAFDVAYRNRAPALPSDLTLRGYSLAGEVVSLGRYHLAPSGDPTARVRVQRRLGGGRVLPLGPAFAVLALTMPHRSALVGDDPLALRPEQALNRCVRGLLAALRGLGVDAYYPGRDQLTLGGRLLGLVSFDADDRATTFEAVLALDDGWGALAERLPAVDPHGVLAVELASLQRATTLPAAAAGRSLSLDELVHVVASAYAAQFALAPRPGALLPAPADPGACAAAWVGSRRLRPGLDGHAVEWAQLGVVEAYVRLGEGTLQDVLIAGDFIADPPGIARVEQELRGCAPSDAAVRAVLERVYADPRSFLLGASSRQIAGAILRAAGE